MRKGENDGNADETGTLEASGSSRHNFTGPTSSAQPDTHLWFVVHLRLMLIVTCVLIFLSALLLWTLNFIRRIMRRESTKPLANQKTNQEGVLAPGQAKPGKPPPSRWGLLPRLIWWLAGLLCALNVLFVIGMGLFFQFGLIAPSKRVIFLGVPPLLITLFSLALVSAFLTAGVVVFAIPVWLERFWSAGRRIHYTLVALAALAFISELLYWNLLGFRI